MSEDYPECPVHGTKGSEKGTVARAWVRLGGKTDSKKPRQRFRCRFILMDGSKGTHTFIDRLPRFIVPGAICSGCGHSMAEWKGGDEIFQHYKTIAIPIVNALVSMASGGLGGSYAATTGQIHADLEIAPDPNHPRRLSRQRDIAALIAKGTEEAEYEAARLQNQAYASLYTNPSNLGEWVVEACADILWEALGPKEWPAGSIVAVDSVKMNLSGKYKYWKRDAAGDWEPHVVEDGDRSDPKQDPDVTAVEVLPVESPELELDDFLDPDDDEDAVPTKLKVIDGGGPPKGLQGGVPCWQVLGAHVYEPDLGGGFRHSKGEAWLMRSYYMPNSMVWAHFFRQLPGTPAYILCDGAHDIKVGIELAWPDPATRPKVLSCEYHFTEVIRKRVAGDTELETAASRLFNTAGRMVGDEYQEWVANGKPGSDERLYHFNHFLDLAEQKGYPEYKQRAKTRTWRRLMDQVRWKTDKLKYSTGALEQDLFRVAGSHLSYRRNYLKNRLRTDGILKLAVLRLRGEATPEHFAHTLQHWMAEHGAPLRQQRLVERGIRLNKKKASLRRFLNNQELEAVGLFTWVEWDAWIARRASRLGAEGKKYKYRTDPVYRQDNLDRRKAYTAAHPEEQAASMRGWYERNAEKERESALERRLKLKASDPEKFKAQNVENSRRYRERGRKVRDLMTEFGVDEPTAKQHLVDRGWDLDLVRNFLKRGEATG